MKRGNVVVDISSLYNIFDVLLPTNPEDSLPLIIIPFKFFNEVANLYWSQELISIIVSISVLLIASIASKTDP